jgi:hypothetical protein
MLRGYRDGCFKQMCRRNDGVSQPMLLVNFPPIPPSLHCSLLRECISGSYSTLRPPASLPLLCCVFTSASNRADQQMQVPRPQGHAHDVQ